MLPPLCTSDISEPPTAADNDTADEIAVAVRLNDGVEFATGVTPREFVAIGNDIYFSVDEAAGADWNGDMVFERVLVRFNIRAAWMIAELRRALLRAA